MAASNPTILIADDHPLFRAALVQAVQAACPAAQLLQACDVSIGTLESEPFLARCNPIFEDFDKANSKIVRTIVGFFIWDSHFKGVLPPGINDIHVVIDGKCNGKQFTWQINDPKATCMGEGDLHHTTCHGHKLTTTFGGECNHDVMADTGVCVFTMSVHPSSDFKSAFST